MNGTKDSGQAALSEWSLTAETNGLVAGHIGWHIGRTRPRYVSFRYAEIDSFYIAHDFSEYGLAEPLIHGFFRECRRRAICLARAGANLDDSVKSCLEGFGFVESRCDMTRCCRPGSILVSKPPPEDLCLFLRHTEKREKINDRTIQRRRRPGWQQRLDAANA